MQTLAPVLTSDENGQTSDRRSFRNVLTRRLRRTKESKKPLVQSYTTCEAMKMNSKDDANSSSRRNFRSDIF
ncbi:hypothetical protein MA16_Dca028953 [Dendrobium catenatum]|uniref:Uncharacterized protein n=1 Tax=Dendrobium catenatum TaxID=906689 RepID=A0A2I0V9F8_9ASPA|nr:hypothetical protein MA16_Dca028953 [Dendrobium catenatum]